MSRSARRPASPPVHVPRRSHPVGDEPGSASQRRRRAGRHRPKPSRSRRASSESSTTFACGRMARVRQDARHSESSRGQQCGDGGHGRERAATWTTSASRTRRRTAGEGPGSGNRVRHVPHRVARFDDGRRTTRTPSSVTSSRAAPVLSAGEDGDLVPGLCETDREHVGEALDPADARAKVRAREEHAHALCLRLEPGSGDERLQARDDCAAVIRGHPRDPRPVTGHRVQETGDDSVVPVRQAAPRHP